jgi:hypothetical protein
MLKSKLTHIALVFLIPLSVLAQDHKLYPGYYLNEQGDTVKCSIEFGDWNKNPTVVHAVGPQGTLDLRPEDTTSFGVYGYEDYVSAHVTYHPGGITGTNLPDTFSDSLETTSCFLKMLSNGIFGLYKLVTAQRIVFFISDHGGDPRELIYRVALKDNQIIEDEDYREALRSLFNKEGMGAKYEVRISRTTYQEGDLLSLVKILNGGGGGISYANKQTAPFELFAFAGGQAYQFPTAFNGTYSVNNHFQPALSPLLGVGMFYNLSSHSGMFKLGLSTAYSSYRVSQSASGVVGQFFSQNFYDSTTYSERMYASNAFATVNLFLVYVMNPEDKIKFYLKGGIGYSYSVKKISDVYSQYKGISTGRSNGRPPGTQNVSGQNTIITISRTIGNLLTGAGVGLVRNQLELCYSLPSKTGLFDGTGTKFKIGTLSLAYGFTFPGKKSKRPAQTP